MTRIRILILIICAGVAACSSSENREIEFKELRIHRSTALEGGEILIIRQIGSNWSATLMGDGDRLSCLYVKDVTPTSGWENLWQKLLESDMRVVKGIEPMLDINDGDGFDLELTVAGQVNKYQTWHPGDQKSKNARRILQIGNVLSSEFHTPVFAAEYKRSDVGDYLIANCSGIR